MLGRFLKDESGATAIEYALIGVLVSLAIISGMGSLANEVHDGTLVLPTIRDAERLQGFPRGWTEAASAVDPRGGRVRWQLVGNAVSVPVAKWIGERLTSSTTEFHRNDPLLTRGEKWPTAAWRMDPAGATHAASLGAWPTRRDRRSLLSILAEEEVERPVLSRKAAAGFLRRFEASNLLGRHEAHRSALLKVLRRHVAK